MLELLALPYTFLDTPNLYRRIYRVVFQRIITG